MNSRRWFAAMVSILCFTALQADDKQAWREKLDTAIPEGIRLLEAKEYASFLKAFVEPSEFEKLTQTIGLEEFAVKFGEKKAGQLLEVLKHIKGKAPKIDGNDAVYDVKVEGFSKDKIKFKKVEKYWYIIN